jgi:hypothetical protein
VKLFEYPYLHPIRQFIDELGQLASPQACLFTPTDLRALLPNHSDIAFKTLLSRAVKDGQLQRVCRGLYLYEKAKPDHGKILFNAVSKLRPLALNYLSLESALSDAGLISQVPMNRITVMSSGRSSVFDCGKWGSIEFVKTKQKPNELTANLIYDPRYGLWRASVHQALRDMRATQRCHDLIDLEASRESI